MTLRNRYAATVLLAAIVFGGVGAVAAWIGLRDEALHYTLLSLGATALMVFLLVSAQRLRDIGVAGLLALLIPVPVFFLHDDRILLGVVLGVTYVALSVVPGRQGDMRRSGSGRPLQLR